MKAKWAFRQRFLVLSGVCLGLAGCALYQAKPIALQPQLQRGIADLKHTLPDGHLVPLTSPLSARSVAALALLNDPDLIAARLQHNVSEAELLNAGLLPDPTISGGIEALISGPADAPAISGALTDDISAMISYSVNVRAAKARVAQVDAEILWREWQVASEAEQLCVAIDGDTKLVASLRALRASLASVDRNTRNAVAAGDLTLAASSSSLAAMAATDTELDTAIQAQRQDEDRLNALLGIQPGQNVAVVVADVPRISPVAVNEAITTLPMRRPDLIALRYGYQQADARLRTAIMAQFLPISVGASGGRDASKVVGFGPQVSLTLPLFNRNRGAIAIASATRDQLAAQYQASLVSAAGGAGALQARVAILQRQGVVAARRAAAADAIAAQARIAFSGGTLDAPSAVRLQTAAADSERHAIRLRMQLLTARLSLATLLGLGLPPMARADSEHVL